MKRILLLLLLCIYGNSLTAGDVLRQKFLSALRTIADTSDCVVGIAIKDLKSGEEILINENEIFPQASSIKVHILTEVYRQAREKKFSLSDIRPLPASMKVGGSGILNELGDKGISMSIRDYAVLMVMVSDNTATNLLIDLVGMNNVNESLKAMGTTSTKLQRIMMDYKAAAEGRENISTPREVMMVLEKMFRGSLVDQESCKDMLSILSRPKSGSLRKGIPENIELANKEGDIEGVRCDVGIVFLKDNPYIICVMTTLLLREADGPAIIADISRLAYNFFERKATSNQYGRRIPR